MRHRLSALNGICLGDEHSTYGPAWTSAPLPFHYLSLLNHTAATNARRSEMGSTSVCESSVHIIDDERRQSVPLCAYRQTRYHHTYTTRSCSVSLYVTRHDPVAHSSRLDPLFDVRKYTHVVQITGNNLELLLSPATFFLFFRLYRLVVLLFQFCYYY